MISQFIYIKHEVVYVKYEVIKKDLKTLFKVKRSFVKGYYLFKIIFKYKIPHIMEQIILLCFFRNFWLIF